MAAVVMAEQQRCGREPGALPDNRTAQRRAASEEMIEAVRDMLAIEPITAVQAAARLRRNKTTVRNALHILAARGEVEQRDEKQPTGQVAKLWVLTQR
jgi:predicted ArsR family transcriptional regulator